jgi:hypothetical protein
VGVLVAVIVYSSFQYLVLAISRKVGQLAIIRPDRCEAMQDSAYELRRSLLLRTRVNEDKKKGRADMGSGPSCEISALSLAPPELFYALRYGRYLRAAICGLRIRSRERSLVDAARHQVL